VALKKSFEFPFIELWYKFKSLWSKDGFIEWLESVTPHTEKLQSIWRTRKYPFYVRLVILSMIYFANCFLARSLSCSTKLVTLVDAIAVHSGSVMTSISY
jgi:hypothetical protein